jgi:RNA polymerase sigma-70 factor (ECF subfamily)
LADPAGADARRRNLAEEGIWLGRVVVELMPEAAEALGLLALMLYAESRRAARRDAQGNYVPLAAQDTRLWDEDMIDEAERLLRRAGRLGAVGRYQLEAAVQSAHAIRRSGAPTDWRAIASIYGGLAALSGSPVAALNRAVALAEAEGAAAGLAALEAISADPRLADYQPYWAARAELLARGGDPAGAAQAYDRAIGLEAEPAVRSFLQERKAALVQ